MIQHTIQGGPTTVHTVQGGVQGGPISEDAD